MDHDGSINQSLLIRSSSEQLSSNVKGMTGLLINGHAGENYILNQEEQIEVVKIARSVVPKDTVLVSGLNLE